MANKICECKNGEICSHETRRIVNDDNMICFMNLERHKPYHASDFDNYRVKRDPLPSRLLLDPLQPILEARGKEYGDYIPMCRRIQAIKIAMFRTDPDDPLSLSVDFKLQAHEREALEMIATKIGRILTGNPNNEDSWRDIAGYATLVADRIPKQK